MSRSFKLGAVGAIISGVTVVFIATQIHFDQFTQALAHANYGYVLPCMVFLLAGLVTRAFRWQALLGGALPWRRAFSIMNVAYLVNGVLPLRLGEVARIYLASQVEGHSVPLAQTTSTIIVERLLDLLAIVVMVLIALGFAPVPQAIQNASIVSAISALIGFAILIVLAGNRGLVNRGLQWLQTRMSPVMAERLMHLSAQFLDGLLPLTSWRRAAGVIAWTALSWLLSVIAGYFLMIAVFGSGEWVATMLYIAAAAFAIAVPAVPGNLGTYEWSIILALSTLGYNDMNQVTAFAVLVHAVNVLVHATTGLLGLVQEGVSLEQLRVGVRQMQHSEG